MTTSSKSTFDSHNELSPAQQSLLLSLYSELSHEAITPIFAIQAGSEFLLQKNFGPLTDEQRKHLILIKSSSDSLRALFEDFIDIFTFMFTEVDFSFKAFELGSVIQQAINDAPNHRLIKDKDRLPRIDIEIYHTLPEIWGAKKWIGKAITYILVDTLMVSNLNNNDKIVLVASNDREWAILQTVIDSDINHFYEDNPYIKFSQAVIERHDGQLIVDSKKERNLRYTIKLPVIERNNS